MSESKSSEYSHLAEYQFIKELGHGGGGTASLVQHLSIQRKEVLKKYKPKIVADPALVRREADVLKELKNDYIPQVYDFFFENGAAYTAMEYIDGQSLNHYTEDSITFSQAQVIKWAIQLLNALSYLHKPIHGEEKKAFIHRDIKPANIMLRLNGDICLIDFNIAIEDGEPDINMHSVGYASPEHYGEDNSIVSESDETVAEARSVISTKTQNLPVKKYSPSGRIIPDARSDIYSLGATLYHLLSGRRPAKDAKEVEPLSKSDFSAPLVDIITKAMNPNPDLRYQTADEMLQAFYDLWDRDPRVIRQKHRLIAGTVILSAMFLFGGLTIFAGLRQMERLQTAHVLAANSAEALSAGDVQTALDTAMSAFIDDPGIFDIPYTPEAHLALTNALGVYDLSDSFKPYATVDLPSAPFRILKTPDETKLIAAYAYELAAYDIQSGELIAALPTLDSALCEIEFLNDNVILFAGAEGLTAYDISSGKTLWTADPATAIAVSGDKTMAATIYKNESRINFYDAATGELISFRELDGHLNIPENDRFADAMRDVFELNSDGSRCAVSLNGGALWVLDIYNKFNDLYIYETSDFTVFDGEFAGDVFAYSAYGSKSVFGAVDVRTGRKLGELNANAPISVSNHAGEIYITQNDTVVKIDMATFEQSPAAYTENKDVTSFDVSDKYVISATDDGFSVFSLGAGLVQSEKRETSPDFVITAGDYIALANRSDTVIELMKLTDYGEAKLLDYDPRIEHSEARLSSDGSVMLFSIKDFTILNPDGSVRVSVDLPDSDKIYDQQYRHDGDYLEVTYYSGKVVSYSAKDGKIISETETAPPDESLEEQFETEKYIINAPLHGAPEVINKTTGKKIAELRADDYLTYITETDGYIIAQYIRTDGYFYGVLMNQDLGEIAILPRLCDISDGRLIYDFPNGNLKTSPIYSLNELKEMAKNYGN